MLGAEERPAHYSHKRKVLRGPNRSENIGLPFVNAHEISGLIKWLTGNARLKGRYMCQDFFARTHKMVLVTNNRPAVKEATEAVLHRLRLTPFGVIIPHSERDRDLMRKLKSEYPGTLAWMARGCVDRPRGGLTEPEAIVLATDAYRGTTAPPDSATNCW